jgi:arginyl-tRNA synthetase
LTDPESIAVLKAIDCYKDAIKTAAEKYEPCIIAKQLIEIGKAYNKFYLENKILNAEAGVKEARLLLTDMTRAVIKDGLGLLLIEAPERM